MTRNATITVNHDDLQALRRACFEKHGLLYGRLKQEASRALRDHADRLLRGQ